MHTLNDTRTVVLVGLVLSIFIILTTWPCASFGPLASSYFNNAINLSLLLHNETDLLQERVLCLLLVLWTDGVLRDLDLFNQITQSPGELGDCSGHYESLTDLTVDQCELPLSLVFSCLFV